MKNRKIVFLLSITIILTNIGTSILIDDFEDNDLNEWTLRNAVITTTDTYAYNNTYSLHTDGFGDDSYNHKFGHLDMTQSNINGYNNTFYKLYMRETSGSYGGGIGIFDSGGNNIVSTGTSNPGWSVTLDPNGNSNCNTMDSADGYDRWIEVTTNFYSHNSNTVNVTFQDLQTGKWDSQNFTLQNTGGTPSRIAPYSAGDGCYSGNQQGTEMWFDYFTSNNGTEKVDEPQETDISIKNISYELDRTDKAYKTNNSHNLTFKANITGSDFNESDEVNFKWNLTNNSESGSGLMDYDSNNDISGYNYSYKDIDAGWKANYNVDVNVKDNETGQWTNKSESFYIENDITNNYELSGNFNNTTIGNGVDYNINESFDKNTEPTNYSYISFNLSVKHIGVNSSNKYYNYTSIKESGVDVDGVDLYKQGGLDSYGNINQSDRNGTNQYRINGCQGFFDLDCTIGEEDALTYNGTIKMKFETKYLDSNFDLVKNSTLITTHNGSGSACGIRIGNFCIDGLINAISNIIQPLIDAVLSIISPIVDPIVGMLSVVINAILEGILILLTTLANALTYMLSLLTGLVEYLFTILVNFHIDPYLFNTETNATITLGSNSSANFTDAFKDGISLKSNETIIEHNNDNNITYGDAVDDGLNATPVITFNYDPVLFGQVTDSNITAYDNINESDDLKNYEIYEEPSDSSDLSYINSNEAIRLTNQGSSEGDTKAIYKYNLTVTENKEMVNITIGEVVNTLNQELRTGIRIHGKNDLEIDRLDPPNNVKYVIELNKYNSTHYDYSFKYQGATQETGKVKLKEGDIVQPYWGFYVAGGTGDEYMELNKWNSTLEVSEDITGTGGGTLSVNWYKNEYTYPDGLPLGSIYLLGIMGGIIGFILSFIEGSAFIQGIIEIFNKAGTFISNAINSIGAVLGYFVKITNFAVKNIKWIVIGVAGIKGVNYLKWLTSDRMDTATAFKKIEEDVVKTYKDMMEILDVALRTISEIVKISLKVIRTIRDLIPFI